MFLSDNAVNDESQDILNRADFSRKLAEEILDWESDESIVVALFGNWGKGKTSILNIAISHIEKKTKTWRKAKRPIIIRFNPWNFSDQDSLLLSFFKQLFSAIHPYISTAKKNFKREINGLAKALGAFEKMPIFGSSIGTTRDVINLIASEETLDSLRGNVDKYFRSLKNKIIIVVDDIDRLTDREIAQIFQLIKINANFPNTIYLTAFDRDVVEMALSSESGVSGREYLEKIIQVGFDVPAVEHSLIEKYLFSYLDTALEKVNTQYWNQLRWGNFYHSGIKKLFRSIRDVKRFINSLSFNIKIVAKEINPIDFIGIEAVRVFLPKLYNSISLNKDLFTASYTASYNQNNTNEVRAQLDKIFLLDGEKYGGTARDICLQLFPQLRAVYPQHLNPIDGNVGSWRKDRRICHESTFDFYFMLGIPLGEVSIGEVREIIYLANSSDDVYSKLMQYVAQGKITRLFDWLSDVYEELSPDGAIKLGGSLIEIGDSIEEPRAAFDMGTDFRLQWLLYHTISRISDKQIRYKWFLEVLQGTESLYTAIQQVAWNVPNKNEERFVPLFDGEELGFLKNASVKKIKAFAANGKLLRARNLAEVLSWWIEWSENDKAYSNFINRVVASPQDAVHFLACFAFTGFSHTAGDYVSKKEWRLDYKRLKSLVDIGTIKRTVSLLSDEEIANLPERENFALKTLLDISKAQ